MRSSYALPFSFSTRFRHRLSLTATSLPRHPVIRTSTHNNATIRRNGLPMGCQHRDGPELLWDALPAPNRRRGIRLSHNQLIGLDVETRARRGPGALST
jgi:hypothetical protein